MGTFGAKAARPLTRPTRVALAAAERIAQDVRLFQAEVADQGCHVVGHRLEGHRAVDVGRAAVGLQIYADDPPFFREQGQDLPNISTAPTPPCSRIMGRPSPWTS
jgi:hypothetical protein